MPRASTKHGPIPSYINCLRVYPVVDSKRVHSIQDLKTVGLKLSPEQAVQLATLLLVGAQEWVEIDLTGYRDDSHVTITGTA